jgi:hypothetical protein
MATQLMKYSSWGSFVIEKQKYTREGVPRFHVPSTFHFARDAHCICHIGIYWGGIYGVAVFQQISAFHTGSSDHTAELISFVACDLCCIDDLFITVINLPF